MRTFNVEDVIQWFSAIRKVPEDQKYRALEGLWDTQINSKWWILEELNNIENLKLTSQNIYVFGGWIGILSSILLQRSEYEINKIYNIDIDPWCLPIAYNVCRLHIRNGKFKAITEDMSLYNYDLENFPTITINTSTEHVSQEVYNNWFNKIPEKTLVVIQGNNFFNCSEHIRCSTDLENFKLLNHAKNIVYEGILSNPMYDRYMCIFYK